MEKLPMISTGQSVTLRGDDNGRMAFSTMLDCVQALPQDLESLTFQGFEKFPFPVTSEHLPPHLKSMAFVGVAVSSLVQMSLPDGLKELRVDPCDYIDAPKGSFASWIKKWPAGLERIEFSGDLNWHEGTAAVVDTIGSKLTTLKITNHLPEAERKRLSRYLSYSDNIMDVVYEPFLTVHGKEEFCKHSGELDLEIRGTCMRNCMVASRVIKKALKNDLSEDTAHRAANILPIIRAFRSTVTADFGNSLAFNTGRDFLTDDKMIIVTDRISQAMEKYNIQEPKPVNLKDISKKYEGSIATSVKQGSFLLGGSLLLSYAASAFIFGNSDNSAPVDTQIVPTTQKEVSLPQLPSVPTIVPTKTLPPVQEACPNVINIHSGANPTINVGR